MKKTVNLSGADLRNQDLTGTNHTYANLTGANLEKAKKYVVGDMPISG